MDPARAKDTGSVAVEYDLRAFPTSIHAYLQPQTDKNKGWFDVTLSRREDRGGTLDITALGLDRVYGLADAVVSKPAHPAVLAAMLARAIESRGAT